MYQTNYSTTEKKEERRDLLGTAVSIIKKSYLHPDKNGVPHIPSEDFVMFYKIPHHVRLEAYRLVRAGTI